MACVGVMSAKVRRDLIVQRSWLRVGGQLTAAWSTRRRWRPFVRVVHPAGKVR
jgi:hypothetical protein